MAQLKLVAAIVVALFVIVLEAEADDSLEKMSGWLWSWMRVKLSPEAQANATEALSFAREYYRDHDWRDQRTIGKLLLAWDRVLQRPIQCDKPSLGYIATIARSSRRYSFQDPTPTLIEATKAYASECMKLEDIENAIKSRDSGCFLKNCFKTKTDEVEFIDDQFIADYWSDKPGERDYLKISGSKSTKAIAKAIMRDRDNKIGVPINEKNVQDYLQKRLYKPCSKYWRAFKDVLEPIYLASEFWEGGYIKLLSSLNGEFQKMFFRYHLCERHELQPPSKKFQGSYEISKEVASDLESLAKSES